ncbi:MAG: LemA family protein [Anaerofustis sp.]
MKFLQSRAAAIFTVLICILLSVFLGGKLSLAPLRADALSVFTDGSDGSGKGIQYDLDQRIETAANQIAVAERYLSADDAGIASVSDAIFALKNAESPSDKYAANAALTAACTALYDTLNGMSLSEKDRTYLEGFQTELESANQIIGHSDYNEKAAEFNALIEKFPTGFVALLSGVKALDLYE